MMKLYKILTITFISIVALTSVSVFAAPPVDYVKVSYEPIFPVGPNANIYGFSNGFGVQTGRMFTPNFGANFSVGYDCWGFKDTPPPNQKWSFSTVPIQLGGKYAFDPCSDFHTYAGIQFGAVYMRDSFSYTFNKMTTTTTNSETKFDIAPFVGSYYPIGNKFVLDANLKYTNIFTSGNNFKYFSLSLGVAYDLR